MRKAKRIGLKECRVERRRVKRVIKGLSKQFGKHWEDINKVGEIEFVMHSRQLCKGYLVTRIWRVTRNHQRSGTHTLYWIVSGSLLSLRKERSREVEPLL